jgi:DTW domain-containing protein YfiP
VWALKSKLIERGLSGPALFEALTSHVLEQKEKHLSASRCRRCYHSSSLCICPQLLPALALSVNCKILVLMHHKEYMSAGNSGKVLSILLPPDQAEIFVYGKEGEMERLEAEINKDPAHALTLWPGDGAGSLEGWRSALPAGSPWAAAADAGAPPLLRIVVLDGVYSHARNMLGAMKKRLANSPPFVALRPTTLSVFHRAQKNYGAASTGGGGAGRDGAGVAAALLLKELGEQDEACQRLVGAVVANNDALVHLRDPSRNVGKG